MGPQDPRRRDLAQCAAAGAEGHALHGRALVGAVDRERVGLRRGNRRAPARQARAGADRAGAPPGRIPRNPGRRPHRLGWNARPRRHAHARRRSRESARQARHHRSEGCVRRKRRLRRQQGRAGRGRSQRRARPTLRSCRPGHWRRTRRSGNAADLAVVGRGRRVGARRCRRVRESLAARRRNRKPVREPISSPQERQQPEKRTDTKSAPTESTVEMRSAEPPPATKPDSKKSDPGTRVPPRPPGDTRRADERRGTSQRCSDWLAKIQLGEPLSDEAMAAFRKECSQ